MEETNIEDEIDSELIFSYVSKLEDNNRRLKFYLRDERKLKELREKVIEKMAFCLMSNKNSIFNSMTMEMVEKYFYEEVKKDDNSSSNKN